MKNILGDGAAAFIFGNTDVIAEVWVFTVSVEFTEPGVRRTPLLKKLGERFCTPRHYSLYYGSRN